MKKQEKYRGKIIMALESESLEGEGGMVIDAYWSV